MADNVPITAGTGTTIATDDIGGVHYQITKAAFGALNAVTLVSAADPLPVSGAVTVSGTVPVSGPLTDTQLRATPVPVSGTFFQVTQPISVDVLPLPTGAATAAKQDTIIGHVDGIEGLLAGTLNVTGTVTANAGTGAFAISAAALPLPSGAATEITLAAISAKTLAAGQATMANSSPVVVASNQSAIPVSGTVTANAGTGTFAVSGTVTANAGSGTFAISAASLPLPAGASTSAKQPALGTAGSAATDVLTVQGIASMTALKVDGSGVTQPVSIAALPALTAGAAIIGSLTANQSVNCSQVAGTTTATGNGTASAGCQRVTVASDNTAFSVNATPPTLTKATQGATGYSTQDLKDAGRAIVNAATAIAGVTAVTSEALVALNVSRDGAATSSLTTIPVTSGKRLRITHMVVGFISTAAAVLSGRFSLRMNPSGAATASSPIIVTLPVPSGAALAQAGGSLCMTVPDGIEFSGTMQIGLSQVCSVTTGTVWASLIGFEY